MLIGGQGGPVWLAGVIEEICEELDQVDCDMGGCGAFQDEVDFQTSYVFFNVLPPHSSRAHQERLQVVCINTEAWKRLARRHSRHAAMDLGLFLYLWFCIHTFSFFLYEREGFWFFWFLVCYAATQLAIQVQQERIQVVRSNFFSFHHQKKSFY